ncbi:MAG: hypothetical protein ABIR84_00695 [Candidatus Nitrotoga sp.]
MRTDWIYSASLCWRNSYYLIVSIRGRFGGRCRRPNLCGEIEDHQIASISILLHAAPPRRQILSILPVLVDLPGVCSSLTLSQTYHKMIIMRHLTARAGV